MFLERHFKTAGASHRQGETIQATLPKDVSRQHLPEYVRTVIGATASRHRHREVINLKKGLLLCFILLSGLLLCACGEETAADPSASTSELSASAPNTGTLPAPEVIAPTGPAAPSMEFPVPYEPGREIYFTCENWDIDLYLRHSEVPNLRFDIISTEPVAKEDISVTLPIATGYTVDIVDISTELSELSETGGYGLPYFLYQIYQGTDWAGLAQMQKDALEAQQQMSDMAAGCDDDALAQLMESQEYQALEKIKLEAGEAENALLPYFRELTPEDLPQFYCCAVRIDFSMEDVVPESFQTINIDIGGKTYSQNVGEVRIHDGELPPSTNGGIKLRTGAISGIGTSPWTDGRELGQNVFYFVAEEELRLTGASFYQSDVALLGARVSIEGANGNAMDFYWDLETSVFVNEGDTVRIDLIYQDERMKAMNYGARLYAYLNYEAGGQPETLRTEIDAVRMHLPWLVYAIAFDGLDCGSYYRDYYYPLYESWREDIS